MKGLKKLTAGIIASIIAMSQFCLPVYVSAATEELVPVSVPLVSNVVPDKTLVLYRSGNKILLKLSDIARLTGADLTYEPVKIPLAPTYGIFSFGVDKDFKNGEPILVPRSPSIKVDFRKQTFSVGLNTSLIPLVAQSGDYYIQAFPLLSALGAVCKVKGDHLGVIMPLNSFWEAIGDAKSGYSATKLTRELEFGDQTSANLRVAMDVFVDLFTPGGTTNLLDPIGNLSSIISNKTDGTVLESAIYEPIGQYDTVKQAVAATNSEIDNFIESVNFEYIDGMTTISKEMDFEVHLKELVEMGLLEKRVSHDKILDALAKAEINEDYNLLKQVDLYGSAIDITKNGLELSSTLYHRLGGESDRIIALNDTFDINTLRSLPEYEYRYKPEPRFFSNARLIGTAFSTKESIILETIAETMWNLGTEELSKKIIELGVDKAVSSVLGNAVLALQIEGIFIKVFIPGQINAAESDIYLYHSVGQMEYEHQIATDFESLAQQESFQKPATLAHLRNSYIVYYQTLLHAQRLRLPMMENAPERYGGDTQSIRSIMEQVCNRIAGILHNLYAAQPVALASFAALVDQSSEFESALEPILKTASASLLNGPYTSKKLVSSNYGSNGQKLSGSDFVFRSDGTFDFSYIDPKGGQTDQSGTGTWTLTDGILSIEFSTYLDKYRSNQDFPDGYTPFHYEASYRLTATESEDFSLQWLSGQTSLMNENESGEGTLQKLK